MSQNAVRQIPPRNVQALEFVMAQFRVEPELGTEPEDLLKPEYWVHVAKTIPPGSMLHVVPVGQAWYARYYVLQSGKLSLKLAQLELHRFDVEVEQKEAELKDYLVKWGGATEQFMVVRISDKTMVKSGFRDKRDAIMAALNLESHDLLA